MRLTGRFELNGDMSRSGLHWRLYAPAHRTAIRSGGASRNHLTVSSCTSQRLAICPSGGGRTGPDGPPSRRAAVLRTFPVRRSRARHSSANGIGGQSDALRRQLRSALGRLRGVLEAPPLSRVWRASGRGAHKMIGVDARFGIVRLMFIIQSSGTPPTDNESLSRAMLYAERGTTGSRSRR